MDIVFINDLRVDTVIGIHEWERRIRQTLVIDLEMAWDIRPAAASDRIGEALDYQAVCRRVVAHVRQSEARLVERLAGEIAQLVLAEFSVPWVRVRLAKPGALREAGKVGVVIERGTKP